MKKIGNILFLYFFVFVMCMGASFAWYAWQGANVNVNVVFSSVDKYINYETSVDLNGNDEGLNPSQDYSSGVIENVDFTKKDIAKNLDLYGSMYLKIEECDSSTSTSCNNYDDLFKSSSLSWTLVSVNNNIETEISTGNFVGEAVGNEIPMYINFELDETITYKVYIWIDDNSITNVDISGLSLNTSIISESIPNDGTTTSKNNHLYIREIEYGSGTINDLTLYSSIYEITGYKITNTETTPSVDTGDWNSVTSSQSTLEANAYVASITNVNHTIEDINNICIKNSNNDVYCKSIGNYASVIDTIPSATLCNENIIYTGSEQQLTTITSDTGYTLSGYNGTNAGTYTITANLEQNYVWGDGSFGEKTFQCNINKKDVTITAGSSSKIYDGTSLTNNNCTADGIIEGHTATCIMTSTSTITEVGSVDNVISTTTINSETTDVTSNYEITTIKGTLTITEATITDSMVTISPNSYEYDGSAKTPTITVVNESTTLTQNTDYTVTITNNTNVGSGTVTITGIGNYTGTVNKTFTISYKTYTITLDDEDSTTTGTTTLYGRYADGIYLDSSYSKKMTTTTNNITIPTLTGYTFGGYYTEENGAGTQMITETGYITSSLTATIYNSNVTLYAKWNINSYTVTLNKGTGISSVSGTGTYQFGESVTITATVSTGYTWSSWTGTHSTTTQSYTFTMPASNVTDTANATANSYTISYSLNGGTSGSNAPTTATYDSVVTISNPTKDGWTFTGWTFDGDTTVAKYGTSSSAVTTSWSDGSTYVTAEYFKNLTSTSGSTITLTAHWEKEMIGTFYYYNGTSQVTKTSTCMLYDTDTLCSFTIPSEVTSSTGLDGASYYGVSTSPSNTTITTTYNSNNLNYYAVYKGSWTATYTKEDTVSSIGSTSNSCTNYKTTNGTTYISNTCSVTLPAINVDAEYIVLGWYNSSNTKVGDAGASITLSSNITYTAKARQLAATDLYYDNTNTGVDCTDAQCMIDEINEILESKE